jgi:hypothetical protein
VEVGQILRSPVQFGEIDLMDEPKAAGRLPRENCLASVVRWSAFQASQREKEKRALI